MVVDKPEENQAPDIDDFDPDLELKNLQTIIQDPMQMEGVVEEGPESDEDCGLNSDLEEVPSLKLAVIALTLTLIAWALKMVKKENMTMMVCSYL